MIMVIFLRYYYSIQKLVVIEPKHKYIIHESTLRYIKSNQYAIKIYIIRYTRCNMKYSVKQNKGKLAQSSCSLFVWNSRYYTWLIHLFFTHKTLVFRFAVWVMFWSYCMAETIFSFLQMSKLVYLCCKFSETKCCTIQNLACIMFCPFTLNITIALMKQVSP
jgi:hypothetical protein